MLLNTITVVGTGVSNLALLNRRVKTSRNCSSRVATCRISFSPALPIKVKCLELTLVQLSLPWTLAGPTRTKTNKKSMGAK